MGEHNDITREELEKKRQPTEVYSRVTGYYRPVQQWNDAKEAEFKARKPYKIKD
jgi:anaerobic ribonucleoside-triphosphate reductase